MLLQHLPYAVQPQSTLSRPPCGVNPLQGNKCPAKPLALRLLNPQLSSRCRPCPPSLAPLPDLRVVDQKRQAGQERVPPAFSVRVRRKRRQDADRRGTEGAADGAAKRQSRQVQDPLQLLHHKDAVVGLHTHAWGVALQGSGCEQWICADAAHRLVLQTGLCAARGIHFQSELWWAPFLCWGPSQQHLTPTPVARQACSPAVG